MSNTINLEEFKEMLGSYYWDCPMCYTTHKEDVLTCTAPVRNIDTGQYENCGYNCNDRPLYKKVSKEILKLLT